MHRKAPSFLMRNLRLEERPGRVEFIRKEKDGISEKPKRSVFPGTPFQAQVFGCYSCRRFRLSFAESLRSDWSSSRSSLATPSTRLENCLSSLVSRNVCSSDLSNRSISASSSGVQDRTLIMTSLPAGFVVEIVDQTSSFGGGSRPSRRSCSFRS